MQHQAFSTLTLFHHSLIISPFSLLHIVPFTTSSWWQRGIGGSASELLPIIVHGIVSLLRIRMECMRIGQVVNSTFGTPARAFDPASKVSFPFYSYHASQHHIISKHTSPSTSPLVLHCPSDTSITHQASLSWACQTSSLKDSTKTQE